MHVFIEDYLMGFKDLEAVGWFSLCRAGHARVGEPRVNEVYKINLMNWEYFTALLQYAGNLHIAVVFLPI